MARQIGDIKIRGTVDDICFYKSEGEYFVRMKGGPSRKQMLHSPAYARTRENSSEFGACSQAGAFLRKSLGNVIPMSDSYMYRRMARLMSRIKNYDDASRRGQRNVGDGLRHQGAKELLCDFSFNPESPLNAIMSKKPLISAGHALVFDANAFVFPVGAAHGIVSGVLLNLDFEAKTAGRFLYDQVKIRAGGKQDKLRLSLGDCPLQKNKGLYFITVRFYTEEGTALQQGALDASGFTAVDPEPVTEPNVAVLKEERLSMPLRRKITQNRRFVSRRAVVVRKKAPV